MHTQDLLPANWNCDTHGHVYGSDRLEATPTGYTRIQCCSPCGRPKHPSPDTAFLPATCCYCGTEHNVGGNSAGDHAICDPCYSVHADETTPAGCEDH